MSNFGSVCSSGSQQAPFAYRTFTYDFDNDDGNGLMPPFTNHAEEHTVETNVREIVQKVFVQKGKLGTTALLTYHDIGTNHESFAHFFNCMEMQVITKYFTVYHVCAPGHNMQDITIGYDDDITEHDETEECSEASLVRTKKLSEVLPPRKLSTNTRQFLSIPSVTPVRRATHSLASENVLNSQHFHGSGKSYPTLEELSYMLESIVEHFQISCFAGFGMGAGSNVLARYAFKNPSKVYGLFLLNPNCDSNKFKSPIMRLADIPKLRRGFLTDGIVQFLSHHWFGQNKFSKFDSSILERYRNHMCQLNLINVASFIYAYIRRDTIGLIKNGKSFFSDFGTRFLLFHHSPPVSPAPSPATPNDRTITVDVALVTGENARDALKNITEMSAKLDPAKTQILRIKDCSGMAHEENCVKLAYNFLGFLRNIGLVITLTPEKLQAGAKELLEVALERRFTSHDEHSKAHHYMHPQSV